MKPKIIESKPITLVGMSFYGDPFDTHAGWDEDNQIGLLWKRLFSFLKKDTVFSFLAQSRAWYEVHIHSEETQAKGLFEVFVGVEIERARVTELPAHLLVKNLSAEQYAIFTFEGEEISSDWEKILETWINESDYQSAGSYNFQYYDERFKGLDRISESVLDVYIPIKKKSD
ncbi:MAG: hypothetical protein CVU42_08535 [Chloroflexi bacterium HGW-Chloroflexi-4]|nr:MAG: hypothetical protein CVU42_08535 [Chloroflexi bacterium HGW-Chloroflexi-4]